MEKLKPGDVVVVTATGAVGVLTSIQYVHNRYRLKHVSNWQLGIENIESFKTWQDRTVS